MGPFAAFGGMEAWLVPVVVVLFVLQAGVASALRHWLRQAGASGLSVLKDLEFCQREWELTVFYVR